MRGYRLLSLARLAGEEADPCLDFLRREHGSAEAYDPTMLRDDLVRWMDITPGISA